MNFLFLHQNFPGQFKHLAPALVAQGHQVVAMVMQKNVPQQWQGVKLINYFPGRGSTPNIHPWLVDFETKTIRAESVFHQARQLKQEGFNPDVIISNPGWGESLFVKDVWPETKLGIYCEFFYHASGYDTSFDPEFASVDETEVCRIRWKNLNHYLHFDIADGGLAPTQWQADSFPEPFRSKLTVIHDGIDTNVLRPNADASLTFNNQITLNRSDEIITFVNRNLEPYRGYHSFMRSLPEILANRPQAKVLIVGGNGVSYGAKPPGDRSWRDIFLDEVKPKLTPEQLNRLYFLGTIPYSYFINLLQISTVHVYLSYPFVLSWSLLESMACGCAIAASNTAPVREVIADGETGRLVDFFDYSAIAKTVCELLANAEERQRLGRNARNLIEAKYDLKTICLPQQLQWLADL
ncbi:MULTISPECIES: glycosyltransferase family 4 protein [unclassified Synechocystis]|uniref:glycosyltransferase family 4 protein n=1 Tax=unclassified Synechocystis TaxID=2640012 RepID=UPI000418ECC4|nr:MULTISPECIES: glycosyltransferase family 4 protein [unclassified Synechocystis]AIE73759.1 putative glycosyltransferase [Synechocystis sp. PCC 6714]MCT0252413.1 glycosyltransferase family 4 protein [Synechocystis sp. CS-94]